MALNQKRQDTLKVLMLLLTSMFETIIETVLNQVLGRYIVGLKSEDLKVSIWSGDLTLSNI